MNQRHVQPVTPWQEQAQAGQFRQDFQGENAASGDAFPILDYLQLLWFRRFLIIAVALFISVIGFIHVNQLVPVYTASSTMIVGVNDAQVVDIEQVLNRDFYDSGGIAEIEVLKSRGLAAKVIEKLNLLSYAEFNPSLRVPEERLLDFLKYLNPKTWIPASWKQTVKEAIRGEVEIIEPTEEEMADRKMVTATNILLGKLNVSAIEWSNVLTIQVNSLSPVLAARIANELPEAYMRDQLQSRFDATEKANAWLTEQLADLEIQVVESERAVEIYREEHNLTKSTTTTIQSEQLSELNSQLIVVRADRAQAEARLAQLMRLVDAGGQGIEMAGDVLSSSQVQQLRRQEAEVLQRESELAVEYGPKHPLMLQVNAEIEDIQQRVENEIGKITLALENELELARTREQSLQSSLRAAEQLSGEQNREAVQLRALEREAAANRVLFETFLNRFKETSSTQGMETSDARVISVAEVPSSPSYPNKNRLFMIFVVMGVVAGCGLVIVLHLLNPGMHSPEQIEKDLGFHTIGVIPKLRPRIKPYEQIIKKSQSAYSEAINSLKISLRLSDPDALIKAIQITSSVPGEGKSTLLLSLGVSMAKEGKKVLIIDGDLRRPSLEKTLGVPEDGAGLTDFVLAPSDAPDEFIISHEDSGIDFMRTGDSKYANATDIFSSKRMRSIVNELKHRYDYVLIDSPPVMAVADARVIGQVVDKTVFVVRWDKTPKKVARAALDLLRKGGTDVTGIVLQQVDLKRYGAIGYGESGYYYHHGRYNKYYQS
jgi:capsular exopolysaccharide synthesis family protein